MNFVESVFFSYQFSMVMSLLSSSVSLIIESIMLVISGAIVLASDSRLKKYVCATLALLCLLFIVLGFTSLYHTEPIEAFGNRLYFGATENGQASGYGRLYDELSNGNRKLLYVGDFKENCYDGKGRLFGTQEVDEQEVQYLIYEGGFQKSEFHGTGKEFFLDEKSLQQKLYYTGQYQHGAKCGYGEYTGWYSDGSQCFYEGGFYNNNFHGFGTYSYINAEGERRVYTGLFEDSQRTGEGTLLDGNGKIIYTGAWAQGEYSGQGSLYNNDGSLRYEGEFRDGKFNGQGTYYTVFSGTQDPAIMTGGFVNGNFEGKVSVYGEDKKLIYYLYYENNECVKTEYP